LCSAASTPISSQVFYLPVYFVRCLPDGGFQPCPAVIGEIAGKTACLFQEHAHVAELRELGFGYRSDLPHAKAPLR
jgi:hypothetical protein